MKMRTQKKTIKKQMAIMSNFMRRRRKKKMI
jgi:hypothetical protein